MCMQKYNKKPAKKNAAATRRNLFLLLPNNIRLSFLLEAKCIGFMPNHSTSKPWLFHFPSRNLTEGEMIARMIGSFSKKKRDATDCRSKCYRAKKKKKKGKSSNLEESTLLNKRPSPIPFYQKVTRTAIVFVK